MRRTVNGLSSLTLTSITQIDCDEIMKIFDSYVSSLDVSEAKGISTWDLFSMFQISDLAAVIIETLKLNDVDAFSMDRFLHTQGESTGKCSKSSLKLFFASLYMGNARQDVRHPLRSDMHAHPDTSSSRPGDAAGPIHHKRAQS